MTPTELAALHARCFAVPRPYSETEFAEFLASDRWFLISVPGAFVLGRSAADEAELVTLAVDPASRRRGIGADLLARFEAEARRRGAECAYLEVAADNAPALLLYRGAGYARTGRRDAYYALSDGTTVDALLFSKRLAPR